MTPHHVLRCFYYRDMAAAELDSADPSTTRGKWLRARVIQKAQRQQELKLKAKEREKRRAAKARELRQAEAMEMGAELRLAPRKPTQPLVSASSKPTQAQVERQHWQPPKSGSAHTTAHPSAHLQPRKHAADHDAAGGQMHPGASAAGEAGTPRRADAGTESDSSAELAVEAIAKAEAATREQRGRMLRVRLLALRWRCLP